VDGSPVCGGCDAEFPQESATEPLAGGVTTRLRDAIAVGLSCGQQARGASDPFPSKERRRSGATELREARVRPLARSADRSGESATVVVGLLASES